MHRRDRDMKSIHGGFRGKHMFSQYAARELVNFRSHSPFFQAANNLKASGRESRVAQRRLI